MVVATSFLGLTRGDEVLGVCVCWCASLPCMCLARGCFDIAHRKLRASYAPLNCGRVYLQALFATLTLLVPLLVNHTREGVLPPPGHGVRDSH